MAISTDNMIIVGNTIDGAGDVTYVGDVTYTAIAKCSFQDFENGGFIKKEIPLVLGVLTDLEKPTKWDKWDTINLFCETIGEYVFTTATNNGSEIAYSSNLIDYKLNYSGEMPPSPNNNRRFLIIAGSDAPPQPELKDSVGYNYRVTKEELAEFQKLIFETKPDSGEQAYVPDIAMAWDFVSNLYEIPFLLSEDQIFAREEIVARDLKFNIADRLVSDYLTISLGEILIPKKYNNSLDLNQTEINLYVPFKESPVTLDVVKVMGNKINIVLVLGVANGDATVNVYLENGDLIETVGFNMGAKYPFFSYKQMVDSDYVVSGVVNNLRRSYISIKQPDYSDVPIPEVQLSGRISDSVSNKGLITFNEIEISGVPYLDEYELLISKLKTGVFVK